MSLEQPDHFVKSITCTEDAFLGGRLIVSQPTRGFRAGLDSVILGAAVDPEARAVLELGGGAGVAGLVALCHAREATLTLLEREPDVADLARANIDRNRFADRAGVLTLDVCAKGETRVAAGLKTNHYDTVIANPPFFDAAAGTRSAAADRASARHMPVEDLDAWVRTAAASAMAAGKLIMIYPASGLGDVLRAVSARFGGVDILPLSPRPGLPASRIVVRATKGSRAGLTLLATRALHGAAGRDFAPAFEAIFRGTGRLDW